MALAASILVTTEAMAINLLALLAPAARLALIFSAVQFAQLANQASAQSDFFGKVEIDFSQKTM